MSTYRKSMLGTAFAAVLAFGVASSAKVESASAHDWVGPAIAGAIVGGIIANEVWRKNGYRYGYNRYYGAPYPYRRVKYRRYHPYPPVYYRPAVVIPLPFFAW